MKNEIRIINLKNYFNYKGGVIKIAKKGDYFLKTFGEVYLSTINKKIFKPWRMHKKNSCNLTVVKGKVKFYIVSPQNLKKVFKITLSLQSKKLIHIPAGLWFAFKNLRGEQSIIMNIMDKKHNDKEVIHKNENYFSKLI